MLMLNLRKGRQRNDGQTSIVPLLRRKSRKYGPVLDERPLSVKASWLVTGAHSSGKTRFVTRLAECAAGVWRGRPAVYLRAALPLSAWVEQPAVIAWHEADEDARPWRNLRPWERAARLVAWVEAEKAAVIFDDLHKLTGRKADLGLQLLRAAGLVVATAASEGAIPISLRMAVQQRRPEAIELDSDAPYDFTSVLAYLLAALAAAGGAWPVAVVIGGMQLLRRGQRAAKQQ